MSQAPAPPRMGLAEIEFYFDAMPDVQLLLKSYKTEMLAVSGAVKQLEGKLFEMADVITYVQKVRGEK